MLIEQNKWNRIKDHLLDGLPSNKAMVMNAVLENTHADVSRRINGGFLMENASAGATAAGNIAALHQVILPLLRRVMPGTIAHNLVGVQPMTSPYSLVATLRAKYAQSASGVQAGAEALAPRHVQDIMAGYSGNQSTSNPGAADVTALEGVPGNAITMEIVREMVQAKSRRLSARWTIEGQQDANAMHGVDLESEIMANVAQLLTNEIDQEILRKLRSLPPAPTVNTTFDQTTVSGNPAYVGDQFAALAVMIGDAANEIAQRLRKPPGNWIVVSSKALTILQSARTSALARTTEGELEGPSNTKYVGTLNNQLKVYLDHYAAPNTPVLVGYKGTTEVDACAYYCPFIPLTATPTIYDPNTLEPVVGFMTRYGWLEMTNQANSFGNSADYLSLIGINANTLTFF